MNGVQQSASPSLSRATQSATIKSITNIDFYGNFFSIFESIFSAGTLPVDPNGIYILLSSTDITVTAGSASYGFCTAFCGFHTHYTQGSTDVKVAWVGNIPSNCISKCGPQTLPTSNNYDRGMNHKLLMFYLYTVPVTPSCDPFRRRWHGQYPSAWDFRGDNRSQHEWMDRFVWSRDRRLKICVDCIAELIHSLVKSIITLILITHSSIP